MTYVMSDIHGMYEKYLKMLDVIKFSDDDVFKKVSVLSGGETVTLYFGAYEDFLLLYFG